MRRAGALAVRFNAPLGDERARGLADWLASPGREVVDLGCGSGAFARLLAARRARVVGIDIDADLIRRCRDLDAESSYLCADATAWDRRSDGIACIGSTHTVGDAPYPRLRRLVRPGGRVVVGDAFWDAGPSPWCRDTFGELPHGLDGLEARARAAGFDVVAAAASTLAEWDAFETGWCAGVGAAGTGAARTFAATRRADYGRYRGVMGFGWLRLAPLSVAGRA